MKARSTPAAAPGPLLVDVDQPLRSRANRPGTMAVEIAEPHRRKKDQVRLDPRVAVTGAIPKPIKLPVKGVSAGCDPRYQVAPGEQVPRLFSGTAIGVDPLTKKPWAPSLNGGR